MFLNRDFIGWYCNIVLVLLVYLSYYFFYIFSVGRKNYGVVSFCKFFKRINILFCYIIVNSIYFIL